MQDLEQENERFSLSFLNPTIQRSDMVVKKPQEPSQLEMDLAANKEHIDSDLSSKKQDEHRKIAEVKMRLVLGIS